MRVRVVRFTDLWDSLADETLIIDELPAAQRHAGTALAFWPDGKLYITVGDATQWERAQFPDYYNGKILRINADGSIPKDNPYPFYATWSLGHRNSQGIARNSAWVMYAVDHGPSIFDGPPGGDEINLITTWSNHGRPIVSHEKTQPGMADPIAIFTPALAPASLMIYKGDMFPEWIDQLFIGGLRWQTILKVTIDTNKPDKVIDQQKIIDNSYGRIRFVWEAPDWSIYFSTSNQDGRWEKKPIGDAIYKIIRK
jgi:glucose/arabinose dehydrogenase